jgi:hypothetical protein
MLTPFRRRFGELIQNPEPYSFFLPEPPSWPLIIDGSPRLGELIGIGATGAGGLGVGPGDPVGEVRDVGRPGSAPPGKLITNPRLNLPIMPAMNGRMNTNTFDCSNCITYQ